MAPTSRNKRARAEDEMRRPKKKLKIRRKQTDYHSSSDEDEDDGQAISSPLKPLKASSAALAPKSILKQSIAAVNEADTRPESDVEDVRDVDALERNTALNALQDVQSDSGEPDASADRDRSDGTSGSSEEDEVESDSEAGTSSNTGRTTKKRNDPAAFANSISKILSTKLTTSKRPDQPWEQPFDGSNSSVLAAVCSSLY